MPRIYSVHGLSKKEPEFYNLYSHIRGRTSYKTNKDYYRYGGRGITLGWKNYLEFRQDMMDSYHKHCKKYGKSNTTIERIDNTKGYSKENCRWATLQEQARNRYTNRYITYKGKTMIIADWARKLNVPRQSVRYRLAQGWDIKSLIETPFRYNNVYDKKNKKVLKSWRK